MSVFCTTFSKFLYGYEVTVDNNKIDFDEGSGALVAEIEPGNYTFGDYCDAVASALNDAGANSYTCTPNRSTRKMVITASGATDFLFSSGDNADTSAGDTMGFNATDLNNQTSITSDNATGTLYSPQFKLQSYIPTENSQQAAFATKNKSATGRVQVQRFGTERFMKCEIQFATDISQPSSGPIQNNASGVDDLRSFMEALCRQVPVEFFVDKDDTDNYESLLLETTPESKDGTGFELHEMRSWRLRGYFETGKLVFRSQDVE